jgi:hypothetical protein
MSKLKQGQIGVKIRTGRCRPALAGVDRLFPVVVERAEAMRCVAAARQSGELVAAGGLHRRWRRAGVVWWCWCVMRRC